jgi:hypothetical protein
MPLVFEHGQVREAEYPAHNPGECQECQWILSEYGAVLFDPKTARHRGWYEGIKRRDYYQVIR